MSDTVDVVSVQQLADLIIGTNEETAGGERQVIAVAGPPGAGKSTVAESLVEVLNTRSPGTAAVFPMDGYHYDDLVLEQRGWRSRKGAPYTFDVSGFGHMLARLRRNDEDEVAVPVFDRTIEIARAGARIIRRSVSRIVVEGNYLLLETPPWIDLADQFDTTVYIDVPEVELRRRLLERWSDLSGEALEEKLEGNDMPNVRLVQSHSRPADFVLRHH
ncbi:MAG: nucleoside/nucleotide kinase family protein [Acidimicrobiia bacterium]|nr:nucleoside/nucleotide kinase family protein [Acidimicrobiia bacterium]